MFRRGWIDDDRREWYLRIYPHANLLLLQEQLGQNELVFLYRVFRCGIQEMVDLKRRPLFGGVAQMRLRNRMDPRKKRGREYRIFVYVGEGVV